MSVLSPLKPFSLLRGDIAGPETLVPSPHVISAEHKRMLRSYFTELARRAGAQEPDELGKQILVIKEGAIVLAHLLDPAEIAADARATARIVIGSQFPKT